jgi:hypothetical protein
MVNIADHAITAALSPALIIDGRAISYGELYARSQRVAAILHGAGLRRGDGVVLVQLTQRVPPDMLFIPFHFHECVNRLTLGLLDPYSRQPAFKQCAVRIERAGDQQAAATRNAAARSF